MKSEEFRKRLNNIYTEIDAAASTEKKIINDMQCIANETHRVAEVAAHSDEILDDLDRQFEQYTGLTSLDVSFLFLATALQIVRQYVFTKFPERMDDQTAAKNTFGHGEEHSNRIHRYYNPSLEEVISNPVPFDANVGANGALAGGGRMGHRVTAIGHDPILGLFFGTANIATSTLTNNLLQSYHITTRDNRDAFRNRADTGLLLSKTKDKLLHEGILGKQIIGVSLLKELIHLRSDLNTKHSLPIPLVSVVDARMASNLAERGLDMANVVAGGKQAVYSILINTMIAMLHGLFYDESGEVNRKIYEVRTRKILSYSNVIASASNLIYVGVNAGFGNESALKSLDIGGLIVTVYRVVTDKKFIREAKREFIEQEFLDRIRGSEFDF